MIEIPAIEIGHLSTIQKRALALADNRISQNAGWNLDILAVELRELSMMDFDIEVAGFETTEVDLLIDRPDNPADDCIPPLDSQAITRQGDLWILDGHRLLCGDARDRNDYARLVRNERARLMFTDPPFNVKINGHAGGLGTVHHREFAMASGEMSKSEFIGFLTKIFANAATVSHDGALHYSFMDWRHMTEITTAANGVYSELKNVCVWVKDNGGMGSFYRSQHELIFVYKVGTAKHINNIELGRSGRYRTNTWHYAGVNTMRPGRLEDLAMHPTVKPVALVADAIKDCSRRGDIVLDPFCGSGTTIVAAEKTGRRAYAIEIDPHYIDVAVKRWQTSSGKAAVLDSSGQAFDEVVRLRANVSSNASAVAS
jgi:DNA modification methylase